MPCFSLLGVEICIPSVDDIVNAVVAPITNFVTSSLSGLVDTLSPLFDSIVNTLSPLFSGVISAITSFLADPLGSIQNVLGSVSGVLSGLWTQISGGLTGLWSSISAGLGSLWEQISGFLSGLWIQITSGLVSLGSSLEGFIGATGEALNGAINTAGAAISGALETAQGALLTAFDGMGNAISGLMGGIFSGFGLIDIGAAGSDVLVLSSGISASLETTLARHSPLTPEEARRESLRLASVQRDYWYQGYIMALIFEGASLGQVDGPATMLFQSPDIAAGLKLATSWYAAPYEVGWAPLLERYYLSLFEPNIPPYQDLIGIYVKEGYLESHWVELPPEMVANFKELGYSEYWTKRLWGKHWEYPGPSQLYEMLHRTAGNFPEIGVTSDVLREMLKLHDFEPKWRFPLEAISWSTWRIFDIRTGWEMDLLDDEGLVKRLIDTGFEPKDARLLAEVQKMFVLRSEIDTLMRESETDFKEGWISEDQLRVDYEATPYKKVLVDLRVSAAKLRRERDLRKELKAALSDRFIKGDLTAEEYTQELSRLGITQEWIATELKRAEARKFTKVKEETPVTTKALAETRYSRAFKVGLITEEEYRKNLAALKYSPEDISLLIELNTPEKPAPEELPTLTLGELKAAFRAGVLSEGELAAELDFRRYSPEDIRVIIDTERAKIKPREGE